MNRKCVYFAEGECEEKLIAALKEQPSHPRQGQKIQCDSE